MPEQELRTRIEGTVVDILVPISGRFIVEMDPGPRSSGLIHEPERYKLMDSQTATILKSSADCGAAYQPGRRVVVSQYAGTEIGFDLHDKSRCFKILTAVDVKAFLSDDAPVIEEYDIAKEAAGE